MWNGEFYPCKPDIFEKTYESMESIKEKTADEYIDKLEEKLIYALAPQNHEFALETKRNFKKIIRKNIDEDTYTIKRELKKYWNNMNTYWLGDD